MLMWRRASLAPRAAAALRRLSTRSAAASASLSNRRVLCVGVPSALAEAAAAQELVQRGIAVDQAASADDLQAASIGDYDALLVSPRTPLDRDLLREGARRNLKLVAVAADQIPSANVDMMDATHHGLMLLHLEAKQAGAGASVEAELALSLLLQLVRHIPSSIATVKAAAKDPSVKVQRHAFTGAEVSGKCLGIVGLGQAGTRVVEMALALGLEVVGYDPNLTQEAAELLGVKRLELSELWAASDFVTFHAPLTGRTRGMFNDAALDKCKPGVRLVSVGESAGAHALLDEATVLRGLQSGQIGGLALDVVQDGQPAEWSPAWEQVLSHDKVLTQAHALGSTATHESRDAQAYRAIAENVCDALARRDFRGVANGVFMPLTLLPEMQPYLALGESLGRFLQQLVVSVDPKDRITKVSLATAGGVSIDITTPKARSALQSALLKGILDSRRGGQPQKPDATTVSLLNSSLLAMTSGMDVRQGDVHERDDKARHLSNCMTVQVETRGKQKLLVQGSVFGEDPRVVRVNEYSDFPAFRPEGNLLIFNNKDKPGAIAAILKELAAAHVNIANFGLARQDNLPLALGILSLDAPPPAEAIAALQALPSVEKLLFAKV